MTMVFFMHSSMGLYGLYFPFQVRSLLVNYMIMYRIFLQISKIIVVGTV